MKRSIVLLLSMVWVSSGVSVRATDTTPASTAAATGLDVKIGRILDSPDGRKVLERFLGKQVVDSQQFRLARGATVRQIARFAPNLLTPAKLETLDTELRAVGLTAVERRGRRYPQNYRKESVPDSATLRQVADRKNLRIGVALAAEQLDHLELVARHFNSVTPENALKWPRLCPTGKVGQYDFAKADRIVEAARRRGLAVRGHVLVWDTNPLGFYPAELTEEVAAAPDPANLLKESIRRHITVVMGRYQGKITEWDVVNEPMVGATLGSSENLLFRHLGADYIDYALRAAHAQDPDVALFINEGFGSFTGDKARNFLSLLRELVDRGVPLHGVGVQSHHIEGLKDAAGLRGFLAQVAELGLRAELTELDVPIHHFAQADDAYQAQGDFLNSWCDAALSNGTTSGITLWGLDDSRTWYDSVHPATASMKPNCPHLFDEDRQRKPAYFGVLRALSAAEGPNGSAGRLTVSPRCLFLKATSPGA